MGVGQDYGVSRSISYPLSLFHLISSITIHIVISFSFIPNPLSLYSLGRVGGIAQFDREHRISYIVRSTGHHLFSWWGGQAASLKQIRGTLISFIFIVDLHSQRRHTQQGARASSIIITSSLIIFHTIFILPLFIFHIIFRSRGFSIIPYLPSYYYCIHISLTDHISSHAITLIHVRFCIATYTHAQILRFQL